MTSAVDELFDEFVGDAEVVDREGLQEVKYDGSSNYTYLSTAASYVTCTRRFFAFLTWTDGAANVLEYLPESYTTPVVEKVTGWLRPSTN